MSKFKASDLKPGDIITVELIVGGPSQHEQGAILAGPDALSAGRNSIREETIVGVKRAPRRAKAGDVLTNVDNRSQIWTLLDVPPIEMTKTFEEGYDAFMAGARQSENPYPVTSTFHDQWNHGYSQASWYRRCE